MYNLQSSSARQAVTPPELLGRVNAAVKTVSFASMSLGALLGGYLSGLGGAQVVLLGAGLGAVLSTLPLLTRPLRRLDGVLGASLGEK